MKTIREWLGKIKSKFKDITQKLNSLGKYKQLFNHKIVFLLIIVFTIALAVVFSQYPQVLTSFAKPPQQPCGISNTRCCTGSTPCNSGLECYAPDASTAKRCKSNAAVCGNSVDRPCCLPDGANEQTQEFCNANLACDTSKKPQYPYQNPWKSGMCKLSYETCGGQNEACCGNLGDLARCDDPWKCVGGGPIGSGLTESCGEARFDIFPIYSAIGINQSVDFQLSTNAIGPIYFFSLDCNNDGNFEHNGQSSNTGSINLSCNYPIAGNFDVSGKVYVTINEDSPLEYYILYPTYKSVVKVSKTTPTPRPSRTPTPKPSRTPTPKPSKTPTPKPTNIPIPTVSYTCNGTCIFATNECYQLGTGTCQSNKYCCKTINSPTPIPPTVVPTKAPNGTACSTASQCTSGLCKTCPGETQGYCRQSGYLCPI